MTTATPDEAAIREAAFYIWLEEGCPEGRAAAHWEAAEARLGALPPANPRRKAAAKPKAASAGKTKTAAATASPPANTVKAPAKRKSKAAPKA